MGSGVDCARAAIAVIRRIRVSSFVLTNIEWIMCDPDQIAKHYDLTDLRHVNFGYRSRYLTSIIQLHYNNSSSLSAVGKGGLPPLEIRFDSSLVGVDLERGQPPFPTAFYFY